MIYENKALSHENMIAAAGNARAYPFASAFRYTHL